MPQQYASAWHCRRSNEMACYQSHSYIHCWAGRTEPGVSAARADIYDHAQRCRKLEGLAGEASQELELRWLRDVRPESTTM